MRAVRTTGRIVTIFALSLSVVWMFTPLAGSGSASLWESASRVDAVMIVWLLVGLALGVTGLFVRAAEACDHALIFIGGATAAVLVAFALEDQWHGEPLYVVFAGFVALTLVLGAALLGMPAAAAERMAASFRATRVGAVGGQAAGHAIARGTPATTTPAGWYPDPSGRFAMRFWDGRAWTDDVR